MESHTDPQQEVPNLRNSLEELLNYFGRELCISQRGLSAEIFDAGSTQRLSFHVGYSSVLTCVTCSAAEDT